MSEEQRPEPKKRRRLGTLGCLRTATAARLHSKPRNEGQDYLELWSLQVNRARWARAKEQAQEKIKGIDHVLSKLNLPEHGASSRVPDEPRVKKTIDFRDCAAGERTS